MKKLLLASVACAFMTGLVFAPIIPVAGPSCKPTSATNGMIGCWPQVNPSTVTSLDYFDIWQPGPFPASANLVSIYGLFASPPPIGTSTTPAIGWLQAIGVSDLLTHTATVTLEFPTFAAFTAYKPSVITTALAWAGAPVVAHTAGFYAAGDGGAATYVWNSGSVTTADNLFIITPGGGASGRWILQQQSGGVDVRQLGVVVDNATSADVKFAAAAAACTTNNANLFIPPDGLLMTGTATVTLLNCPLRGIGLLPSANTLGSVIKVTSTSVKPFIIQGSIGLEGVNFFYPNQTGAVVYQPLFNDDGNPAHNVFGGYIHNVAFINPYAGLVATPGVDWSNIEISDSYLYSVQDTMRQNSTGDSWRIANTHFTHGIWASVVGYPTVAAYLNAADQTNTILHVQSGVVTMSFTGTTTFAWRYGVKVDTGGIFLASKIDGLWDGVQTFIDTSASNACAEFTTFTGSGWASYQPVFSSSGAVTLGAGNAPAFNFGPGSGSCHSPPIRSLILSGPVAGSYIVSAGQEVDVDASTLYYGAVNDGNDYYAVHLTANPGEAVIAVRNSNFGGFGAAAKMHGITEDVAAGQFIVTGNTSANLNDVLEVQTGANTGINLHIRISDNTFSNTFGTATMIAHGFGQMDYHDNDFDKPIPATVSCPGGSAATVFGGVTGSIHVGTGTATMACDLTLSTTPLGGGSSCIAFSSSNTRPFGGPSGAGPVVWHYQFENDAQGTQLAYSCLPQQ